MNKKKMYWKICSAVVIVLAILVFTPLIIPANVYKPMLFGIPFSLWTSFLITVILVVTTLIGTKVHPGLDDKEGES